VVVSVARKLKTYQTSIGFFDLAVATPSMNRACRLRSFGLVGGGADRKDAVQKGAHDGHLAARKAAPVDSHLFGAQPPSRNEGFVREPL